MITISTGLLASSLDTPLGQLRLVAAPVGLRAVLWPGEDGTRVARALGESGSRAPDKAAGDHPDAAAQQHLGAAARQLEEYFAGRRRHFDLVLDPVGTTFQKLVWETLRSIPFGQTRSYRAQAAQLGDPAKARAVGAADGRNPLSIVVPCHRVVSASGALTGFAGGLDAKSWLLEHERAVLAAG